MKQLFCLVLIISIFLPAIADEYQVSVTTVNVWIRATDASGNPVKGLQANDFELFEDNKKMAATCFEEVHLQMPTDQDVDGPSYSEQTAAANAKRLVLFLDLYNTSENEFNQIHPELDRFMRRVHLKGWQMMMAAYLNTGQLGIVVPFTQSISTVRKALDQAKGNSQRDQRLARNDQELIELLAPLSIGKADTPDEPDPQGPGETTRASNLSEADKTFYELAISNAYRQANVFARNEKQAAEHAFGGLESFGEYYGKKLSSGEHTLILFVSGGINSDPGRRYFDLVNSYVERTSDAQDRADFTLKKGLVVKESNFDLERLVNNTIGKLNRYNLTLYSINTRGLPSSGADITKSEGNFAALDVNFLKDYQDSLAQMAEETGGFTFQNSQNFKVGFDNVLNDISHQYLICYRSPDHKKPNEYHSIKVVAKKPGLKLRYRQGYVD